MKKEEKQPVYVLCPRCELNYINKKDKLCTVCKAEMGLIDSSVLLPDEEEIGVEKICPVCHVNYIGEDEEICFMCLKEREEKAAAKNDEWDYSDEENPDDEAPADLDDDDIVLSDDEMPDDEFDDEFERGKEPDDFTYEVDEDDFLDREEDEDDEEDDDFPV